MSTGETRQSAPVNAVVMQPNRYRELMENDLVQLTDSEFQAGWHFCLEWDGLLVGPGMPEIQCCSCMHCIKPEA